MAKPTKDTTSVTARLLTTVVAELDALVAQRIKERPGVTYTRTDALNEILPHGLKAIQNPKALEIGIAVIKNIDKIKDPQLVAELRQHLEDMQIVDYVHFIATHDKDHFDALAAIVFDELRLAAGKTPFSLLSPAEKKALLEK